MNSSALEDWSSFFFSVFTLDEPSEASARDGEHGRHPGTGGGAVQRQKRLDAEAGLAGRPARRPMPSPRRRLE